MQTNQSISKLQSYKGLQLPAKIISYLFHPLFMPTILAVLVSYLNRSDFVSLPQSTKTQLLLNIAMNTIFYPLLCSLLLKALGFIESIQMKTMKERIIPLIASMIFYFWTYSIVKYLQAPLALRTLILGAYWGIIVIFIANIFFKISMHSAAAGGAIGIIIVMMMLGNFNLLLPLLITILLAGIIGTARMVLHAHQPADIWLGYLVGILVQLGAYLYLK